jgi:surface protein
MLNKFKPRYKTNKKIVDWEPTPDSKSRTRDRDKGRAGSSEWVKYHNDGQYAQFGATNETQHKDIASDPQSGDTYHLYIRHSQDLGRYISTIRNMSTVNLTIDFAISKISPNGDPVWEKAYGFPTLVEGGSLRVKPSHDGITPALENDVFETRPLPNVFPAGDTYFNNYADRGSHFNAIFYAEGYLYACVLLNEYNYNSSSWDGTNPHIYPPTNILQDDFIQGLYVVKIDARTGEVVDDSYTHLTFGRENDGTGTNDPRGICFSPSEAWSPVFNYDPYKKTIVCLASLINDDTRTQGEQIGSDGTPQDYLWGTAVFEVNASTMVAEPVKFVNYRILNALLTPQIKNTVAFSPTNNFLLVSAFWVRFAEPSERANNPSSGRSGSQEDVDIALIKFDKNWNVVDRKQYGYTYPGQPNDWENTQYGDEHWGYMTQGYTNTGHSPLFQIFYSESKDKIYATGRPDYYGLQSPFGLWENGKAYTKLINPEVELNFRPNNSRIIEIEPSDLSVSSVKWSGWIGKDQDGNIWPRGDNWDNGNVAFQGYTSPSSMSPDGKYIYLMSHQQSLFSMGDTDDQVLSNSGFHHYLDGHIAANYYADSSIDHTVFLRYNVEKGEFDLSWTAGCFASEISPDASDLKNPEVYDLVPYRYYSVRWPQGLVALNNGCIGWIAGRPDYSRWDGAYADDTIKHTAIIKLQDSTEKGTRFSLANLTNKKLEGDEEPMVEGVMISKNGTDAYSTFTEPQGYLTSNERFIWEDPESVNLSGYAARYYTRTADPQAKANHLASLVSYGHKMSDLIGESHKAYDQDNLITWETEWQYTYDSELDAYLINAREFQKPFYRPATNIVLPNYATRQLGGEPPLCDEITGKIPYQRWIGTEYNNDLGWTIAVGDIYSNRGLLPPLPETDHHVFYSTLENLTWSDLPTSDPDNGSLELSGKTISRVYYEEYPETTFYRYKAIFDWDARENDGTTAEIHSVERFGLNSITGKRNQIKNGNAAFQCLYAYALDLGGYHGQRLHLKDEEHMWDRCGPGLRTLDTSNLMDMSWMFAYQEKPISGPTLSQWDISNVTNMEGMFFYSYAGEQQLELRWDTSNVQNMRQMFAVSFYTSTTFLVDMRTWEFKNADVYEMFNNGGHSIPIVNRNVSLNDFPSGYLGITDNSLVYDDTRTCDAVRAYLKEYWGDTKINVLGYESCTMDAPSNFTVMVANREITDDDLPMYGSSEIPEDTRLELINSYETPTRSTQYVYKAAFPWNNSANSVSLDWLEDVLQFGGNRIESGNSAFQYSPMTKISAFDYADAYDLHDFEVSNLTDFSNMFLGCSNFDQDISHWDTSNATSMASMFNGCDRFNGDIGSWEVGNVEYMDAMFFGCSYFNQDISGWDTKNVVGADNQFNQASSFNRDLSPWCVRGFASEPPGFATGADMWSLSHPIWGTCPRNEDGNEPDDFYHIFVANANDIYFPVPSDDKVGYCFVDGVQKDYVTEIKGQILEGSTIKAGFDWDNGLPNSNSGYVWLDWVAELVQIGFNTETMSNNQIKNGRYAFQRMPITTCPAIENLDTSNLTQMDYMFYGCYYLNADLSGWDISNVTNMFGMFYSAWSMTPNISGWNTSNVTEMRYMFYDARVFNDDISGWDISGISEMDHMFRGAWAFNQNISGWNTSNITSMAYTFRNAKEFDQDISSWDTSNVTNMSYMFYYADSFNQDLSQWCVSNFASEPTSFSTNAIAWVLPKPDWGNCPRNEDGSQDYLLHIFTANDLPVNLPCPDGNVYSIWVDNVRKDYVSEVKGKVFNGSTIKAGFDWDNSVQQASLDWVATLNQFGQNGTTQNQIKNGSWAFKNMDKVASTIVLSNLDTSNLTDMSNMFSGCSLFNSYIGEWDVSNVTNMSGMFNGASSFNKDIFSWNTANVTDMSSMFNNAATFNRDLSEWCVSLIASEPTDFATGATSWVLEKPVWGTCPRNEDGSTPESNFHIFVANDQPINLPCLDGDVSLIFVDGDLKDYLTEVKGSTFNGSTVKAVFDWDNSVQKSSLNWIQDIVQIGIYSEQDTLNMLKSGDWAFYQMDKIVSSDVIKNLNVSNLTSMTNMFSGCSLFNSDVLGWNVSNVTDMSSMFMNCSAFNSDVSAWDTVNVTDMSNMFMNCSVFNSDIGRWKTNFVTNMDNMFNGATLFNQNLSGWCVGLIETKPADFDTGADAFLEENKPVWGTCVNVAPLKHKFVSSSSSLAWTSLPTTDADNGSLVLLSDQGDGTYVYEADFTWNNASNRNLSHLRDVLEFKDNEIASGRRAFYYSKCDQVTAWLENPFTIVDGSMEQMFYLADSSHLGMENIDTSNVTTLKACFQSFDFAGGSINPDALLDLSGWDVSNVTDMSSMMYYSDSNYSGMENWDTSNVTTLYYAFRNAFIFNGDISGWDTSNVTSMSYAFYSAYEFNQDLSGWCVSQFSSEPTGFDTGASAWTLPKPVWGTCPPTKTTFVTNTPTLTWDMLPTNDADNGSISLLSDNGDGTWTFEADALYDNSLVQRDLSWMLDVTGLRYNKLVESYAFNGSPAASITALPSDLVAGEDLSYMFANMPNFNQDISGWDVSATTNMDGMFSGATSFNQNLSNYCVYFIATKPTDFDTGATAFLEENKPVWGCCGGCGTGPTTTTFTANTQFLTWDMLPTDDAENGTLQLLSADDTNSVYEWGADFAWNNATKNSSLTWLLNVKTIKDNKIGQAIIEDAELGPVDKTGRSAFRGATLATRYDVLDTIDFSNVTSTNYMFYQNTNFNQDLSGLDTSNVTEMSATFWRASSFNGDVSTWQTGNVTSMSSMFRDTNSFASSVANWDVSNVENMYGMFYNASSFNGDLSGWNTSSAWRLGSLFRGTSVFNSDISGWDVSACEDFSYMFYQNKSFNRPIGDWDTSSATTMNSMFRDADGFNQDIGFWDVSNVTDMDYMFYLNGYFNQDLSGWCVPQFDQGAPYYFDNSTAAWSLPRPPWGECPSQDTVLLTNTPTLTWDMLPTSEADNGTLRLVSDNGDGTYTHAGKFLYDNSTTQKNLSWMLDIEEVFRDSFVSYSYAFNGSPATSISVLQRSILYKLKGDVSYMCANMPNFNQDISYFDTFEVTNMEGMFSGASSFNQDLSEWCVGSIESEPSSFSNGTTSWTLPKPVWGTCPFPADQSNFHIIIRSNSAGGTVFPCPDDKVFSVYVNDVRKDYFTDVLGKALPENTVFKAIFDWDNSSEQSTLYCIKNVTQFGLNTKTGKKNQLKNGSYAFRNVSPGFNNGLGGTLDALAGLDTSNLTDMSYMFRNADDLTGDLGNWDVSNVKNMRYMFNGANMMNPDLSNWNVAGVEDMRYIFYEAYDFNSDISDWDTSGIISRFGLDGMFYKASSFNQDLSLWCVSIATEGKPGAFDSGADAWTLPRPVWGTCPRGEDGS